MSVNKVLFVTPEVHPLVKTGGLADVSGSLPIALKALRCDIRITLPAYKSVLDKASPAQPIVSLSLPGSIQVRILETRLPGSSVKVWLVDSPRHFHRDGGPYLDQQGKDWPDNAERFATFARAVERIALGNAGLGWRPELVHCNDWQSGLVPALLSLAAGRPATVFTIHNLSYQGLFPREVFTRLDLPAELWSMHGLEYFGSLSFIKGGLVYADMLSTVSPQYAREICTPAFGCGLESLLQHRSDRLVGILNGADYREWNPARDPYIPATYNAHTLHKKQENKAALQREMRLPVDSGIPLLGMIGRLVEQKGFDLVLDALPELTRRSVQLVVLGSGEKSLERRLQAAVKDHPAHVAAHLGYDEALAHRIEAGCDMFVMPSRFEPCGLNQIYSLRYGTVPIVHRTGGLANTVIDATEANLKAGIATGFMFDRPTSEALLHAVGRALECYRRPRVWKQVVFQGMQQDFSWRRSAQQYLSLYRQAARLASLSPPRTASSSE
jgi:starch synthase